MCGATPCGCPNADTPIFTDYHGGAKIGNPVYDWPGWQDNDARYSVQTDINPIPIVPVHFQQWPGMQPQLSNGWQNTNYGKRDSYDDYLRLLYSTTSYPKPPKPMPYTAGSPTTVANPSQLQQQSLMPNQVNLGGTGVLAPGVAAGLSQRRYYG